MNRILEINEKNMYAVVEPYVIYAQLQAELMKRGLNCNITGAGSNCSALPLAAHANLGHLSQSGSYGERNQLALEWVTGDGEIIRMGSLGSCGQWFSGDGPGPSLRGIIRGNTVPLGGLGVFTKAAQKLYHWPGPAKFPIEGVCPHYTPSHIPEGFLIRYLSFSSIDKLIKEEQGTTRRQFVIELSMGAVMMAAVNPLEAWESSPILPAQGEKKYAKYIVTALPSQPVAKAARGGDLDKLVTPKLHHILALNNRVAEGSIMVNCSWVWVGEDPGRMDAHAHPYAEVIGFAGSDPKNANDLGGEAEFWMDDEKYIIDKSFLVYIPEGLKHCPLIVRNITRNIFHFDIQLTQGEFRAAPLNK